MNSRLIPVVLLILVACLRNCHAQDATNPSGHEQQQSPLRDLDSYFPFDPPQSLEAWQRRKSQLRTHLLVALGLWPLPEKCELKPVIHGKIEKPGYTIEKVYFESIPGFYVTGNLYQPDKIVGQVPAVLCPHGHFANGRFNRESEPQIDQSINSGAEKFRSNARSILQARCANLARMGCIVFHYDMIGYADSQQISYEVAHRFATQRPEMNNPEAWGLFSPQAESNLQSVMGLQTWNSIRCLDFLCSLPEVDQARIGVTGASGGGTQTFVLCAVDDRPAVAFPAVMVSTAMQGGCTCENCSLLRIGTGNVEMAAMFAPKPIGLTAANDWTKEMETKGYPELKRLYALLGSPENVQLSAHLEFGHNYNQVSREAMYAWFKRHFRLPGPAEETEIEFVEPADLSVFDAVHQRPSGGDEFEQRLLRQLRDRTFEQMKRELQQTTPADNRFDQLIGTYVDVVHQCVVDSEGVPELLGEGKEPELRTDRIQQSRFITGDKKEHVLEEIKDQRTTATVLILDSSNLLLSDANHPQHEFSRKLLDQGWSVASFQNGTITAEGSKQTRKVANPREALCYTLGYNPPQLAQRAAAWLTAADQLGGRHLLIVALDESGLELALNSKYLRGNKAVRGIAIDTHGFRFQNISDIRDPNLLPGVSKYFDLPGLLTLAAPKPMLIFGEDPGSAQTRILVKAYEAAGAQSNLQFAKPPADAAGQSAMVVDWIKSIL